MMYIYVHGLLEAIVDEGDVLQVLPGWACCNWSRQGLQEQGLQGSADGIID